MLSSFQKSRLGAFVQSPLKARGLLANGLTLLIGYTLSGNTGFNLIVRLLQEGNQIKSASVSNTLDILNDLEHPPAFPKEYLSFNGYIRITGIGNNDDIAEIDGQTELDIPLTVIDGEITYLGTVSESHTINLPDWTYFYDPAGSAATNLSYDKIANSAKPSTLMTTITVELLNQDKNKIEASPGEGNVQGSFQMTYTPLLYTWKKRKKSVGGTAGITGSIFIRYPGYYYDPFPWLRYDSNLYILVGGSSESASLYKGHYLNDPWNSYFVPSQYSETPESQSWTSGSSTVSNVSFSSSFSVPPSLYTLVGSLSVRNPNADSGYFNSLFSDSIPVRAYGFSDNSITLPVLNSADFPMRATFGDSLGTQTLKVLSSTSGGLSREGFGWFYIDDDFHTTGEEATIGSELQSWIDTAVSLTQESLDSMQQSVFSAYNIHDGPPGVSVGYNILTMTYLGNIP